MVITGADRIAATATPPTRSARTPWPCSPITTRCPSTSPPRRARSTSSSKAATQIPIEERGGEEITHGFGRSTAPENAKTYSPAFDVTPAELITAIVTEKGIIEPVDERVIRSVLLL